MRFAPVSLFPRILPTPSFGRALRLGSGSAILCAACISPMLASEMKVSDLRLGFGILATDFRGPASTTVTESENQVSTTNSSSAGRNADENFRFQVQYISGRLSTGGGFIWGVGAAINRATWDNGQTKAHATTPMATLKLGYGLAVLPNWHFELTPFGSYGQTFYSITSNDSSTTQKDRDHYFEYGASLGTYYAFSRGLVLGIEVPYLAGHFSPKYNYTNNDNAVVTVSDKRRNRGFGLVANIGYRF